MPKTPTTTTATAPRKRQIDWKRYGAREADEGDRTTWRAANEGDSITGTLGRVDEANTRFGSKVLVELDDCTDVVAGGAELADGSFVIWPTPGLINALDESAADLGDRIVIELTELIDTGKGNPFKRFSVEIGNDSF